MNIKNVVIVLPTYNEKQNIGNIIKGIQRQIKKIYSCNLYLLIVDDYSPDGTADIVKDCANQYGNIHLISGKKQGLGAAYIRGFKYAMHRIQADVVFEMDADLSHNPNDIPRLLKAISSGNDFVIGSRYTPKGSIPNNWSLIRKLNSKWGNIFARRIVGINKVKDCTSGFRAIKTSLLKKIDLDALNIKGYAFQVILLHQAIKQGAIVSEVPINFKDRALGKSKIRINDIVEFIQKAFLLRFATSPYIKYILLFAIVFIVALAIIIFARLFDIYEYFVFIFSIISIFMTLQALFTLWWMLYAWDHPERVKKNRSPEVFCKPKLSFSAIVPARNEEEVIGQTIIALSEVNYPERLKEIIVVCRFDDEKTIDMARKTISILGKKNIKLALFNDFPINKPHALNIGLQEATKNIVVVFDAEDEPHKDIFNIANTVMSEGDVDVLQSGVQLMNYRSTWFSTLNVLEYFFWFKSTLQFFASVGIIPLGGNTVFLKKDLLIDANGWDESCLTEDADIGIRLSSAGARIKIVYDEQHVTQEESPLTLSSFVKQRTRWSQGFIQILFKGQWLKLSGKMQKFLAMYILVSPELQGLLFVYIAVSLLVILFFKLPVWLVMLSSFPFYVLVLQLVAYSIGLYLFSKDYKLKFPLWLPLKIMFTFLPFQIVLGYSAARAVIRLAMGNHSWEKTQHVNAHRVQDVKFAA